MPSPLDILGGLGQIGGLGAIGAYQGEIEGKKLQKDFETRDLENQMRMLRNMQIQQNLGPQYSVDAQGRILVTPPGQPPRMVGELPMGQFGQGRLDLLQAQSERAQAQAAAAQARAERAEQGPTRSVEQQALDQWRSRPENQGKSLIDFVREYTGASHPEPKPAKAGQIPAEHQQMFEDWRQRHPGGTYLDFYRSEIKPPKEAKEPPLGTARFLTRGVAEALTAKGIDPRTAQPDQIARAKQDAKADREKSAIEQTRARLEMGQAEKAVTAIEKSEDQLQGVEDLANRQEELAKRLSGELGGSWGTAVRTPLYAIARHAPVGSKLQDTLGAFETINGQFAKVALGVEGLTSTGRIAVQNVQRALAFHAKENEPLSTQLERVGQLRRVVAETRAQLQAEKARERTRIETLAPRAQPPSQEGGLIDLGDQ